MMHRLSAPLLLAAATLLAACQAEQPASQATHAVTIMTFNVENLFDNKDDAGKDDRTFLPLAAKQSAEHIAACGEIEVERWRDQCLNWDWSDARVTAKLENVAAAILQVDDGRGPDVLALQEVENLAILERLRRDYLADAGYGEAVLIEGNDLRGIDVAFLSRLPLVGEARLHPIKFSDDTGDERVQDTRGILEATFALPDGVLLTGFAVHFPAPFHPTEMRIAAYQALEELASDVPGDHAMFAAGDFNTTSIEDRQQNLLDEYVRPNWTVAHDLGCGEDCRGSSYYARDDSWSFLDMILWAPPERGENTTWGIRADSVHLANIHAEQRRDDGTPKRFDAAEMRGVSDHWPLVLTIETQQEQ